jgi:peroxiredoxin Q/BCP
MSSLTVGDPAPTFILPNQDNITMDLAVSLGQFVVIYFYPKAMTSGCTVQACDLRDNWALLSDKGIKVFGISPDKPSLLKKFKILEKLPFDLLSDSEHIAANLYGTWIEKSMYGKSYMGKSRDTFIIKPDGTLLSVLHKVKPSEHLAAILTALS